MDSRQTKSAESHLDEDTAAPYDALTAPVAVKMPGHGKEAQHADRHTADRRGSHIKHVGHTLPRARGQRHAPEGEKKGGFASWGTLDPSEVLEDEMGAGKEVLNDIMEPETKEEEQKAIKEATLPDNADKKTITLADYEKKVGHEI